MASILVVGSANMDVVTPINRMPTAGETLHAGEVQYVPGGKGANAAIAAARVGGNVRFAGCVGSDPFGACLRQNLQESGVDITALRTVDLQTGAAVILLNEDTGENSILVSPGANAKVDAPADPAWYRGSDAMLLQLEIPRHAAIEASQRARQAGIKVILDPAPAPKEPPRDLLAEVDLLLPNETELASLTGRSTKSLESIAQAAVEMQQAYKIEQIVVTLGKRGAMLVTNETVTLHPPFQVEAVDTTAAGDAFAGALAVALADGEPIERAIRFATAAGAITCTKVGAQTSIPTATQVHRFLKDSTTEQPTVLTAIGDV